MYRASTLTRVWIAAGTLLLATAAKADGPIVAPFEFDRLTCPCPVIEVSINGKAPLRLLLNTASRLGLIVNESAAKRVGLEAPANGKGIAILKLRAIEFAVESISYKTAAGLVPVPMPAPFEAGIGKGDPVTAVASQPVDGYLGLQAFRSSPIGINFLERTLTIGTAVPAPNSLNGYLASGLSWDGSKFMASLLTDLKVQRPRFAYPFAPFALLTFADEASWISRSELSTRSFGGNEPKNNELIVSFTSAQINDVAPELRLLVRIGGPPNFSTNGYNVAAQIGAESLCGYDIILDWAGKRAYLRPNRDSKRLASPVGDKQLEVELRGNRHVISTVKRETPAWKATLRTGELIERVNNRAVAELTPIQLERSLRGSVGTPVTVHVRRNGSLVVLTFDPLKLPPDAL